jgi:uncharacterized protein YecT (DUF1311 family)
MRRNAWIAGVALMFGWTAATVAQDTEAACAKARAREEALEKSFHALLGQASKDPALAARIRKSQEAWQQFRSAQLQALYGGPDPARDHGSVWRLCSCLADQELMTQRLDQLRRMQTFVEGDVCGWKRP